MFQGQPRVGLEIVGGISSPEKLQTGILNLSVDEVHLERVERCFDANRLAFSIMSTADPTEAMYGLSTLHKSLCEKMINIVLESVTILSVLANAYIKSSCEPFFRGPFDEVGGNVRNGTHLLPKVIP
jgi:hypothetical protein